MTNHILWLLSYMGLSLALSIGNRQTTIGHLHNRKNYDILASVSFKSFKPTTSHIVHNWLVYDKHQKRDNILLLDDILSTILGNDYKKKQRHKLEKSIHRVTAQGASTSQALNFLYDENDDKIEKKEKKERTVSVAINKPRTILRNGSPYGSVAMYVDTVGPISTIERPRFDTKTLNENLHLPKFYSYMIDPSVLHDSKAAIVSATAKRFGKRSRISSSIRQDIKELEKQKLSPVSTVVSAGSNMASQFIIRSARGNRQYDVPQIECPLSDDGMERFACPTADRMGRYRCIDDHVLCDGFIDCPMGEDEDRQACMFYKTTKAHLDVLADALLRWARGR